MSANDKAGQVAAAKRLLARTMSQDGKFNADIQAAVKKKFGSGMSTNDIADIRADLGNGRRKNSANVKHDFTKTLVAKGKSNEEIREAVKKKFGSGIHNSDIAKLRGTKGTRARKVKQPDLVVFSDNGASATLKSGLVEVLTQMRTEGIRHIAINDDGTVRYQRDHEIQIGGAS